MNIHVKPPKTNPNENKFGIYVRTTAPYIKPELGLTENEKITVSYSAQGLAECSGLVEKTMLGLVKVELPGNNF